LRFLVIVSDTKEVDASLVQSETSYPVNVNVAATEDNQITIADKQHLMLVEDLEWDYVIVEKGMDVTVSSRSVDAYLEGEDFTVQVIDAVNADATEEAKTDDDDSDL
jgi:hypothetical protein